MRLDEKRLSSRDRVSTEEMRRVQSRGSQFQDTTAAEHLATQCGALAALVSLVLGLGCANRLLQDAASPDKRSPAREVVTLKVGFGFGDQPYRVIQSRVLIGQDFLVRTWGLDGNTCAVQGMVLPAQKGKFPVQLSILQADSKGNSTVSHEEMKLKLNEFHGAGSSTGNGYTVTLE